MNAQAYEIYKILLQRPLARLFWRMAANKAVRIAAHVEAMKAP